jgi:hypothetical protein
MAGVAKERIRDWMSRRFPPTAKYVGVFECADVTQLLAPGEPTHELVAREGMLFASRDRAAPAPRRELVILTSVLANYSVERIITALENTVAAGLEAQPHLRLLIADDLRVFQWGPSSTGAQEAETEPCDAPPPVKAVA